MITFLKKYAISVMAPSMRCPSEGVVGWMARRLMRSANPNSTRYAIRNRMDLKPSDVLVELGAGEGAGITAVVNLEPRKIPSTVHLIEISDAMRAELERVVAENLPSARPRIEIHSEDCREMPYLEDDSVDVIFGMNVVYFLDPLPVYMKEIHRVLKPGGEIIWGCKFDKVPKNSEVFVNVDEKEVTGIMRDAGFQVSSEAINVVIDTHNDSVTSSTSADDRIQQRAEAHDNEQQLSDIRNYIEIKGTKVK